MRHLLLLLLLLLSVSRVSAVAHLEVGAVGGRGDAASPEETQKFVHGLKKIKKCVIDDFTYGFVLKYTNKSTSSLKCTYCIAANFIGMESCLTAQIP